MYAPPINRIPGARTGIIAFSQILTDDRQSAIVEFVAADRAAFQDILADTSLKTFEKGKVEKAVIELEIKKSRKDFDLQKFGAMVR